MTTFPAYNAYPISKCKNCKYNGTLKLAADIPDNELCGSCKVVRSMVPGAKERSKKYDKENWEISYIAPNDNGFVATEKRRIDEGKVNKTEIQKFDKELRMCKVLADNGFYVEYLHGVNRPKGQTYDIHMNNIKADLKCITGGVGNMVGYASKVFKEQGGEAVVFEIPKPDKPYYKAMDQAKRKYNGRIFFYLAEDHILKEI